MCGFTGFIQNDRINGGRNIETILNEMNGSISHRGPDDEGVWIDNESGVALAHRRLSIIDLSTHGSQPMLSNSNRFVIVYNGEVYNYLDIKKELTQVGIKCNWKGSSDTEVILAAIEYWGLEESLKRFVGMFSFALWDRKYKTLSLARDRVGEKPLYFGWQKETFLFGSELKALRAHPNFLNDINRDSISLLLRHNCIPSPYSIYNEIYKLEPGKFISLNRKDALTKKIPEQKVYWELDGFLNKKTINSFTGSRSEAIDSLESLLTNSVKGQLQSDVPLGAFLSGGVDSSLVVAIAQKVSKTPIKTFTIGSDDKNYNEAHHAKRISKFLGTNHTELYLSPNEIIDVIPMLPNIYDEPFSDSSQLPTFLISKLAKEKVSVALSGDGGDEIFGGYNRYIWVSKIWEKTRKVPLPIRKLISKMILAIPYSKLNYSYNLINQFLKNNKIPIDFGDRLHKLSEVLPMDSAQDIYFNLCSHWKNPTDIIINCNEPKTKFSDFNNKNNELDIVNYMMNLDLITYLPDDILVKIDRASMANSLEVRVPLLDHRIINFGRSLPLNYKIYNNQNKWILRKILYKYVPKELMTQRKMGFSIPIGKWLRGPLRDWADSLFDKQKIDQDGYFDGELIKRKWSQHLSGKYNFQYQLWDVLMFQAWLNSNK